MDVEGYTTPRQTFGGSIPAPGDVPYFTLNETRTQEEIAKGNRVKVFNISFQPNQGKGWYRLRLFSKTNKIVGEYSELVAGRDNIVEKIKGFKNYFNCCWDSFYVHFSDWVQ